ncbi:tRNA (adenine(22)-N(1))-methyltransferase TrmK [Pseudoalteromonas sp. MMG010]|uniref:tRNA (adenine(22)-N(1))-methyltransferase TrmK n=1 Tax=Pseudoalteromonas sp. MMG010 TaxID=2822685 RepID=UPI001B39E25B|nr:tRNA (adenine(22)-N(1))-methyltransferase TrmK [Pseudoalteromonas sp. MMG010]MBQ4833317.1 tRNA (adenine(22)-N(1))-methyltransferase TrmK [Pseudoalteromonas sp. MMG010]
MSLSKRLSAINMRVTAPTDVVWDCCCDHGQLGLSLLARDAAKQIRFVDIVPDIMHQLTKKLSGLNNLSPSCNKTQSWQVLCQDVGNIRLDDNAQHVIIIAGVGGELLLELVKQIVANNDHTNLANSRFIVCPVLHTYHLREGLKQLGFGLLHEQIVLENKRFYEVLEVSFNSNNALSLTGSLMWDFTQASHVIYHQQLLRHYNKMVKTNAIFKEVIADYQMLI